MLFGMPMPSSSSFTVERSSTRSTTLSPNCVGSVETRRSTGRPAMVVWMRPSCGTRRSAMLRFDMTLMREVTAVASERGGGDIS